jgi:hypothetical protein
MLSKDKGGLWCGHCCLGGLVCSFFRLESDRDTNVIGFEWRLLNAVVGALFTILDMLLPADVKRALWLVDMYAREPADEDSVVSEGKLSRESVDTRVGDLVEELQ